jgi:hypothetical protein
MPFVQIYHQSTSGMFASHSQTFSDPVFSHATLLGPRKISLFFPTSQKREKSVAKKITTDDLEKAENLCQRSKTKTFLDFRANTI